MITRALSLFLFIISFNFLAHANEKEAFYLAIPVPKQTPEYQFFTLLYNDLFSRIDKKVYLQYLPLGRARIQAERQLLDGEGARVKIFESMTKTQVSIPEPLLTIGFAAYVRKTSSTIKLQTWQDLKQLNLYVDYQRGAIFPHAMLTELVPTKKLSTVTDLIQGLHKLSAARSDIFIGIEGLLTHYASTAQLDNVIQKAVLSREKMYLYINKQHAGLSDSLTKHIIAIKKEKLIQKYKAQAFSSTKH